MAFLGISVSILAQLFNGTVSVFDKFLLSRNLRPTNFAFWISLTSLSVFILLPFGFALPASNQWFVDLAAGATFVLAVFFMYVALEREEVTRVIPIIGCLTPVFTLLISNVYLGESFVRSEIIAIGILLLGIVLLTYRHSPKHTNHLILASAYAAAFLFALSSVLMKEIFTSQGFISGLCWSRLGGLIIIPIVLLDRQTRYEIFVRRKVPQKGNFLVFLVGRIFSGGGFILINLAYSLISPVIVNSLQGIQYALIFVANLTLKPIFPKIITENYSRRLLLVKILGLVTIIIGTIILSRTI